MGRRGRCWLRHALTDGGCILSAVVSRKDGCHVFIATTHARDDLDEAAFRRFDRLITFRLLTRNQREALVRSSGIRACAWISRGWMPAFSISAMASRSATAQPPYAAPGEHLDDHGLGLERFTPPTGPGVVAAGEVWVYSRRVVRKEGRPGPRGGPGPARIDGEGRKVDMKQGLSKSKLMAYRQCPRRLWLSVHKPEAACETEEATAAFATGHAVGAVARGLYPEGRLITENGPLDQALHETAEALKTRPAVALFEATVSDHELLVRADILRPAGRCWDLIEVKSATRVKDHYYDDLAIQTQTLAAAGLAIRKSILQCIDSRFVYPGEGCYQEERPDGTVNGLFREEDLTKDLPPLVRAVVTWRREATKMLASSKMPPVTDRCEDPYPCPFIDFCYDEPGPEYPLACLPRLPQKDQARLGALGYRDIRDIPSGVLQNDTQEWVRAVTVAQKPDRRAGAAALLDTLDFPRYYLDFETIGFAVPLWAGTRPYEQLPFQWSCHKELQDGTLTHEGFLDLSGESPLRAFADSLISAVKRRGPIFVYNQGFEGRIIGELSSRFPDLADALEAIRARLVDLLPLARRYYYHPAMKGSWSIKAVLPTIVPDLDYTHLEGVQDGGQAQQAYLEAIAEKTSRKRRQAIAQSLDAYCQRDTEALVHLAHFLAGRGPVRVC